MGNYAVLLTACSTLTGVAADAAIFILTIRKEDDEI